MRPVSTRCAKVSRPAVAWVLAALLAAGGCANVREAEAQPKPLRIVLAPDGEVTIDGETYGPEYDVADVIREKVRERAAGVPLAEGAAPQPPRVILAVSEDVPYADVARLMLACGRAGVAEPWIETPPGAPPAPAAEVLQLAPAPASPAPAPPEKGLVFGVGGEEEPRKIVYVLDRSGSMTDSLDHVKFELKRCIGELSPERFFHIIFYSSGPPLEMPARRLVEATERNKRVAFEFIDGVIAHGQTDPSEALKRAFAVGPDVIYFLNDGELDRSIVDLVRRLNPEKKVQIHTIGFLYDTAEEVLKQIAAENGGGYRFVSERDLANLVK